MFWRGMRANAALSHEVNDSTRVAQSSVPKGQQQTSPGQRPGLTNRNDDKP